MAWGVTRGMARSVSGGVGGGGGGGCMRRPPHHRGRRRLQSLQLRKGHLVLVPVEMVSYVVREEFEGGQAQG